MLNNKHYHNSEARADNRAGPDQNIIFSDLTNRQQLKIWYFASQMLKSYETSLMGCYGDRIKHVFTETDRIKHVCSTHTGSNMSVLAQTGSNMPIVHRQDQTCLYWH